MHIPPTPMHIPATSHVSTSPSDLTLSLSKGESASQDRLQSFAAAVVFREVLKPLARGLGPVGEIAVDSVADALFLHDAR